MKRDKLLNYLPIFLLLLPILHLVGKTAVDMQQLLHSSPEVWRSEVERLNQQHRPSGVNQNSILVLGGRQVSHWKDLDDTLAPLSVETRGIGSATVEDLSYHLDGIIGDLQPQIVVLLPDRSNFHLRESKNPRELLADIQQFSQQVLAKDKTVRLYIYPPLQLPAHPQYYQLIKELTSMLESWAKTQSQVSIIDANRLLYKVNHQPNPRFFHSNGSQLNALGYLTLAYVLRHQLEQDFPKN